MLPFDRLHRNSAVVDDAPRSRRLTRLVATSVVALLASAAGCGDDTTNTQTSTGGGSPPTTTGSAPTTTSSTGSGQGGEGASGQGGDTSSTTSQGGGGASSTGTGLGGAGGQGGAGVGGQGGAGGQGVGGQGGAGGQGVGGQGGAGVGGQGGAGGQGVGGQGGAGQGGAAQSTGSTGGPICTTDADCNDDRSCTVDTCLPDGSCSNAADATVCDNGNFCDGTEACDPANGDPVTGCTASSGDPCDDDVGCTNDSCDEANDACVNAADDTLCDNAIACDGIETCDAQNDCQAGVPQNCDDGFSCTTDVCSAVSGECENIPVSLSCDNGLFCDGVEQCLGANGGAAGTGCADGPDPVCNDGFSCTQDSCNEAADACAFAPNNAACGNNNVCDGIETCDPINGAAGTGCATGTPLTCADGIPCTVNSCNPATGCVFTPDDTVCDDGSECNGTDVCTPGVGCQDGTPVVCADDGIPCTVESCDEDGLDCLRVPDNSLCPIPGQFCNLTQGCIFGQPCDDAGDCDDGDACNGDETCGNGVCQAGDPIVCDDGADCTIDLCDPGDGSCDFIPDDGSCQNGDLCDGIEQCVVGQGCVDGTAVVCTDAFSCTSNSCDQATGQCQTIFNNAACSDGDPCNGTEQCTGAAPGTGCSAGAPLVCPGDGIGCTAEVCVPGEGCQAVPDDDLCPCGQTCGAQGCGNFCQVGTCQGKVYECGDCLDNDGDCRIDSGDTMCLGTCDNTEDSLYGGIPGQNNSPCKSDCYFDQDTGSGNDDCYWSHKCDPLEVAPNYYPEGSQCEYNPNSNIPGYGGSCATAFNTQSALCGSYCGPLTPNGCDCFGCCDIEGIDYPIWLGSQDAQGNECTLDVLGNPNRCKPCTQVPACLNTCETCELCIGKDELPPECDGEQQCPAGDQACGLPGQPLCPSGQYCVTGCCQPVAD